MAEPTTNITQEFFGRLFDTVSGFARRMFEMEISDASVLDSDEVQELLFKTKQILINITKDNIVKSASREEFKKNTKQSLNDFIIDIPSDSGKRSVSLLEICGKNEDLLNRYLEIFEIPEQNFREIKDSLIAAEQSKAHEEKARSIKLEVKKEPKTEDDIRQERRIQKIMERVQRLFQRFGEAFARIFRSEGAVLNDAGVLYKGKVDIEKTGQLIPTVGITPSREEREKRF